MAYGRALIEHPQGLSIPSDPTAAMVFAIKADRDADAALAVGRFEQAERLGHTALEARCRATGRRA